MAKNKNNLNVNRIPEEVMSQLIICVQDLINDASLYDSGKFQSIKRSSAVLRMLFHNKGSNRSLVNQYEALTNIRFTSFSNKIDSNSDASFGPILATRFNMPVLSLGKYYDTFLFFPDYEKPKKVTFNQWWYGKIFVLGSTVITRFDLVKTAANQDGGAHFDPAIPLNYSSLIKGHTGFTMAGKSNNHLLLGGVPSNEDIKFIDIHLALLRMIVHEAIVSLIEWFKLPLEYVPDFSKNINSSLNNIHFKFEIKK